MECVYAALDEINEEREDLPPLEKAPETELQGAENSLDSLSLVNLVIAVEEGIELSLGATIVLSDDRALSAEPSPFRSVGALAAYVDLLLEEEEAREKS